LVLDPVAEVARDEARVVDEDAKARRPRLHLRAVEHVQLLLAARRRLPRLAELREEAVQLRRRDPRRVLRELDLDAVEQALDPAARPGRDREDRRALAQAPLEARAHVLDRD